MVGVGKVSRVIGVHFAAGVCKEVRAGVGVNVRG